MRAVIEWGFESGDVDATFALVMAWVVVAVVVGFWYLTRGGGE